MSGDSKERASKPQKSLSLPRPGLHRYIHQTARVQDTIHFHQHCTILCLTEDFLTSVYVKDVERLFEINDGGSLLLLVPIRLGGESLNPIYIPCVQVRRLALDRRVMLTNSTYHNYIHTLGSETCPRQPAFVPSRKVFIQSSETLFLVRKSQ